MSKVYFASAAPPVRFPNVYGIDMPTRQELIATGRTAKQVTGFRGRTGRSFRAKLALVQNDEGRWRVEFDEPWAQEGAKAPETDEVETPSVVQPAAEPGTGTAAA